MEYTRLGDSGLTVSRIILGCMSYGDAAAGNHPWTLSLDDSRPFFRAAIEAGITTFDTANVYGKGSSEEFTGQLVREFAPREEVVLATKLHGRMSPGPNGAGLSRGAILHAIDESLRRLGTDYVDLYQIHRFDPNTPPEETMEALHDVVKSGKVRYLGASSMWAWQFAQLQYTADAIGGTRFVSMQDQYSLLQREEEREMHPFCVDQGVGVLPWSPLARGRLTKPWDDRSTSRAGTDPFTNMFDAAEESNRRIVDAVGEVAGERDVSRAQVALAWVLAQPVVTAPIVGATKPQHLDDALAALDLELTADEIARLEQHYTPRAPEGFN